MNWERRAVLRGVAGLTGVAVGSGVTVGSGVAIDTSAATTERGDARQQAESQQQAETQQKEEPKQQVETPLTPGVTLFDLDGDGEFTARVERASAEMQDEAHPGPIHVSSGGSSTVDYAASIAEPPEQTTLGELQSLSYEYYEGPDNASSNGAQSASAPDETFLVVENADGRHGMYLTADDADDRGAEEWWTFDVLARMQGEIGDASGWFEYTGIESGYDGKNFQNVLSRFGADAELALIGIGRGDAVNPAVLDVFYDNLTINGQTKRFPDTVANRVSSVNPF